MERTSHSSTPVKGEAALSSTEKRIYIFEKAPVRRAVLAVVPARYSPISG